RPVSRLKSVDFPEFGGPTTATTRDGDGAGPSTDRVGGSGPPLTTRSRRPASGGAGGGGARPSRSAARPRCRRRGRRAGLLRARGTRRRRGCPGGIPAPSGAGSRLRGGRSGRGSPLPPCGDRGGSRDDG